MNTMIGMPHPERWAAALGGAALVVIGAKKITDEEHPLGAVLASTGAGLIWRSLRRSDTRARLGGKRGTLVEESVAINRPASELFEFWRHLEGLPKIMPELLSVRMAGPRRSHWIAKGPSGLPLEWDADIINGIPDELIAWRTTEGSSLASAGSVHFEERQHGRGTVVRVKLQYDPPGGKIAALFARAYGQSPSQVIREGLRRFKQLMETGEIPTTDGQPRGGQ